MKGIKMKFPVEANRAGGAIGKALANIRALKKYPGRYTKIMNHFHSLKEALIRIKMCDEKRFKQILEKVKNEVPDCGLKSFILKDFEPEVMSIRYQHWYNNLMRQRRAFSGKQWPL
jgi:chorismate mutase